MTDNPVKMNILSDMWEITKEGFSIIGEPLGYSRPTQNLSSLAETHYILDQVEKSDNKGNMGYKGNLGRMGNPGRLG